MGVYGSPDLTPRDDTFKGMVRCRKCGNAYHHDLKCCPNCGAPKNGARRIVVIMLVFVLLFGGFYLWKTDNLQRMFSGDGATGGPKIVEPKKYSLGETLSTNRFRMTLIQGHTNGGNVLFSPSEGMQFLFMEFEYENLSKNVIEINYIENFKCYIDNYLSEFSFSAALASEDGSFMEGVVDPGRKLKGWLCYEIPQNAKNIEIIFMPDGEVGAKYTFVAVTST